MLDAKHGNSRASGAQVCALARGGVSPPAAGGLPVPQELGAVGPQPLRGYPSPTGSTSSLLAWLSVLLPSFVVLRAECDGAGTPSWGQEAGEQGANRKEEDAEHGPGRAFLNWYPRERSRDEQTLSHPKGTRVHRTGGWVGTLMLPEEGKSVGFALRAAGSQI